MSKSALNIFNISIYNQLIHNFNSSLVSLEKYNSIYEKMQGYYTKEEIHYIVEVYMNQMIDIINSSTFDLFVPIKVKNEILRYLPGIKSNFNQHNYRMVIKTFNKIKNMFFVDVKYEE